MRVPLLCFPLWSCFALAGTFALPAQNTSAIPSSYTAEPLVIEHMDSLYRMQADGTGIHEKSVVARIQSESSLKQLAVLSTGFAANSEKAEWVYARLHHQDGSVTETPVASAIEVVEPVTREAPFYSDLKELQLPLKDLRVGDRLEWKVRLTRTKAEAPGNFWGQESFEKSGVILSESLQLDIPKDAYLNLWSPDFKPVETVAGERRLYRFTSSQPRPTVGPEADAFNEAEKKRLRTPEEELDIRRGKLPDVAWTTFKSWEAVGAWYRALEAERMLPDADIKAKVAQLTAGKATENEKVQAVYSYVALQIHYIGVAFGVGRYQPHSASDVLGNQYGDCKDKHTLLAAMLAALDLKPDAVLIGAGIRFNPAVPSPSAFNHLITRLQLQGKPVWLDTTAEVAPFGMLLAQTRDHEALIVPASGPATVEKTPAQPAVAARDNMESNGTLDAEGTSKSRIAMTFRGDNEIIMRAVLRQISPAQYDELAQHLCASMGYAGTASHLETSRIEDLSQPLAISFDYKRSKAGDWDNLRTVPQLSPAAMPRPDDKEPPVASIELGAPRTDLSSSSMALPQGWAAELPEAVHLKSKWATYDLTYRFEKGTLYAQRKVEILEERVAAADWKTYSRFADKANNGDQYVQLTRGKAALTLLPRTVELESSSSSEISSRADAAKLIETAYTALQHHDLLTAEPLLNQVRAVYPDQPRLWGCLGDLALQHGELTAAITDYQKELSLHPSSVQVYPVLARTQVAARQRQDARETIHRWIESAPDSAAAPILLAGLQLEDGSKLDLQLAVQTTEEAVARGIHDDRLQLLEGRTQLKAGLQEKGHATLLALLKTTDDSGIMNDAAYELADAGLELPLAEQTARAALDQMEQQSQSWTLDENIRTLAQQSRLLQATWDTLGWILFREGKLDQAESFVRASWLGRRSAEVGGHLAEIELARGDKNTALADLELARACSPQSDLLGVRSQPGEAEKSLERRADALRKAGAHSSIRDANASLQKLRTLNIGAGSDGVAEYKLLVNAQGLVKAEPVTAKTVPDAAARIRRARLGDLVPRSSKGQLVVHGILNCHQGTCELLQLD